MTVLAQARQANSYRLAPSLIIALAVTVALGLAFLALISGVAEVPNLTGPLSQYAPGAPDLHATLA